MTQEKFKRCPACQNFIPDPAMVCMYCGAGQEAAKPVKKKGGLGKILLWLVAVFFGCIVLAVVGSFLGDGEGATTAPASNAVVRPTFTPTTSAVDAALALATMVPTVEVPTPMPTPTVDLGAVGRQLYFDAVGVHVVSIGEGLSMFGPLLENPRIGDNDWTLQMGVAIAKVRIGHEDLEAMMPPPALADFHSRLLDATGDCSESTDYLASGIDNFSTDDLNQAVILLLTCNDKVRALTAEMNSFGG